MLHILILIQTISALKVSELQSKILLLPKTSNSIAPFTLVPETDNERSSTFRLKVQCNENLQTLVEFSGSDSNFCTEDGVSGSAANLNTLLQGTFATIINTDTKSKDLAVQYTVYRTDDDSQVISLPQQFTVVTEVPIRMVNKTIYYQPGSSTTFGLKIMNIQADYLRGAKTNEFTIVPIGGQFPNWMQYQFENGELYFSGRTPTDLNQMLSFTFTVQDRQTGLFSEDVEVQISGSLDGQPPSGKALVIILFLIFTGIIACVLLIIFVFSKKAAPNGAQLKQSVAAHIQQQQQQHNNDSTTNVLSDSILQWNKKMVEKHKNRMFSMTDVDEELNRPGRSPGFAYERFDDTFEVTEDDRNPDIRMSDKLSEIHPDDDNKNRDDNNRSSFLDDLRF